MSMSFPIAVGVATVAVGVGGPIGLSEPTGSSPPSSDVTLLRVLLAACAIGLIAVTVAHARAGRTMQATGNGLAGIGLGVAATFGGGIIAWIGLIVAGIGGVLVVRDARRRRGRRHRFA